MPGSLLLATGIRTMKESPFGPPTRQSSDQPCFLIMNAVLKMIRAVKSGLHGRDKDKYKMMDIKNHKSIHLIGIGGAGVSGLAFNLSKMGKIISGSDINENDNIKSLINAGMNISIGHNAGNIPPDTDLSGAGFGYDDGPLPDYEELSGAGRRRDSGADYDEPELPDYEELSGAGRRKDSDDSSTAQRKRRSKKRPTRRPLPSSSVKGARRKKGASRGTGYKGLSKAETPAAGSTDTDDAKKPTPRRRPTPEESR